MKILKHILFTAGLLIALPLPSAGESAVALPSPDEEGSGGMVTTTPVWAVKNNLLYDATLTPNLGIEVVTGRRTTVQLFYGLHPWTFHHDKKIKHWSLMPEWRRWLHDEGPMEGWFWGIHALGGEYDAGGKKLPLGLFKRLRTHRYEGWYAGGGLTLGHCWRLSDALRLEAALGVGYLHTRYDDFESGICGAPLGSGHYNYVGPTKLALNVAYVFGKKTVPAPPVIVTPPPVVLPYVPTFHLPFITPQAEAEKARQLSGRAFLDFVVNKTDIRPTYRRNTAELAKVQQTIDVVRNDPNTTITHVSIHGYASPEGSYQNNTRLASGRAQAFKDYIQMLIALPADIFSVASTPEDWQGLAQALKGPRTDLGTPRIDLGTPRTEEILAVINGPLAPDEKERQLKRRYPAEWKLMLDSIFPALRHSDYEVSYTIRPFTVEEARLLIRTKPQQLSLNEMFLVANTYTPGSREYNDVFETAVRMYPDDATANLNAAIIALNKDDLDDAARFLAKAGDSPEAVNARGVLLAKQQRYAEAEALFRQAASEAAQHNMEEVNKMQFKHE